MKLLQFPMVLAVDYYLSITLTSDKFTLKPQMNNNYSVIINRDFLAVRYGMNQMISISYLKILQTLFD